MDRKDMMRHRAGDALIGLLDGGIQIGGVDARGLFDEKVVRALYDGGLLSPLPVHGWTLTPAGVAMAKRMAALRDLIEGAAL
jgi:hypothetical protein